MTGVALCLFLTTEEKAWKNLNQGSQKVPVGTMKTEILKRTYITIRIHKHNNKNTYLTKLNKSIQNIQPYIQDKIKEPKEHEGM